MTSAVIELRLVDVAQSPIEGSLKGPAAVVFLGDLE